MAQAPNQDLTERFISFYRNYYAEEISRLAQHYPNEQRSLYLDYNDLYTFDPELAEDFLDKPEDMQEYAEEALRLYDLPADISLGQAHVRLQNLPAENTIEIRNIRVHDDHIGSMIAVKGTVQKATDVRPRVIEAAFECQRCGTMTYIPQSDTGFQEPQECQGCERQGPFRVNNDQSEFVDSQRLRVQESPEDLQGGETPQSIDVNLEDDICGQVAPGDNVTITGPLHIEQVTSGNEKTPMFDCYMDGMSLTIEDEQFEDMEITDEDKKQIVELSNRDDLYDRMIGSIAPSIYGYEDEKLAIMLQLFSGVSKQLPDKSRIRGDLHILLIGDPGTGKCLKGDEKVLLGDGTERTIRSLVEENLTDPKPVDDGVYDEVDLSLPTMTDEGEISLGQATKVWKREAPEKMYQIRTASGNELEVTPSHPLFVQADGAFDAKRAEDLSRGDFIATPRTIAGEWSDELDVDYRQSKSNNAVRLDLPDEWTTSLARLVGYIIAEGNVRLRADNTGDVRVTNADEEIIADVTAALDDLGLNYTVDDSRNEKSTREVRCTSSEFASFLRELEPAILERSAQQRVPDALKQASPEIKRAFLRAYVDAEGHVSANEREIAVSSMSDTLLEDVQTLLLAHGIETSLEERANGSFRLRISGEDFVRYVDAVGFVTDRKTDASRAFDDIPRNTNTDVIPDIGDELRRIRETLELSQSECGLSRSTYQHYERGDRNPSAESLREVVAAFEKRLAWLRQTKQQIADGDWDAVTAVRDELNLSQRELAEEMAVEQTAVSYYERNEVVPDGGKVAAAKKSVIERIDDALAVEEEVQRLRNLVESDVSWDRIESITAVEPDYDWVYDLEVAETHNYITNNVVSHNSQLLSYVRNIAPRAVYTSGKGSSSAGLTAAAVRDEFGDGQQWTLEAGALVLADNGVAAIDELDKMDSNDRSAMHEALEQQRISISKAGINATLKSRCSLLGAANPKHGRFDKYEKFGEQIDLEPPLISRFDLIFAITDDPDPEEDQELAEHILDTNFAGEIHKQNTELATSNHSGERLEDLTATADPDIEPELLRKYVAYAKTNCFPTMTQEARDEIRDFYVNFRKKGADEDSPVPVTARKLEAMVRLAEASARVRLSDTVELEDAQRILDLVMLSLEQIGVDPETGEFDADIVESGTSKSQRDRIKSLKQLIDDIESDYEMGAPVEEVLERADEIGLDESKAEDEIEKLKRKGDVYEPTQGHLRTT